MTRILSNNPVFSKPMTPPMMTREEQPRFSKQRYGDLYPYAETPIGNDRVLGDLSNGDLVRLAQQAGVPTAASSPKRRDGVSPEQGYLTNCNKLAAHLEAIGAAAAEKAKADFLRRLSL